MNDAGVVLGSYAATIAGVVTYSWWVLRRARRVGAQVREEDRPWT